MHILKLLSCTRTNMRLIKLDRRHHGFHKWTHALEFTKKECHFKHLNHTPYVRAFNEIYGNDRGYNDIGAFEFNENWRYDHQRRRIYFKDPSVLTFVELKVA